MGKGVGGRSELGLDVLVETTGDDDVAGAESADNCSGCGAFRNVDGRHAIRAVLKVERNLVE